MLFPLSALSIVLAVLIILLCCLIMAKFRQAFDKLKIPLAIFTVLGGLLVYTVGYMPDNASEPLDVWSVTLRALFSTCRIFIMESDIEGINEALHSNMFFLMVASLIHMVGAMLTVMTVLSFFGMKFLSRLRLLVANAKQVYLFLGLNEATECLIKSLKEKDGSRLYIVVEDLEERENDDALVGKLKEEAFILLDHDWEKLETFKQLKIPARLLKSELHVFALSDEDNYNVQTIYRLFNQACRMEAGNDNIHFYINTRDEGIEKTLESLNQEHGTHHEFKVFSLPDLTARQLFQTYPIHDVVPMDTERAVACSGFTLFIAGLEPTGVEVLRKSIYLGQFIGGEYRAIVTDEAMNRKRGHLFNKYPEINCNYNIETHEAGPGSEEFYRILQENLPSIQYIVVALGDDQTNMETAIEIQRLIHRSHLQAPPIVAVHIRVQEDFEHVRASESLPNLRFFGRNTDIFTENIIINEGMDRMARQMNALFNSIYHIEPADNWGALDSFTKESNRSAAANIPTKLRLLGLEMIEKGDKKGAGHRNPVNLMNYLVGERLDNLARQEHLRWNAFHYASGWTSWPLSPTGDAKKAKDLKNKRHACLVSWDELEAVTRHFNQNPTYQQLDYEQVKNICKILEYCGYEVYERSPEGERPKA